MNLTIDLDGIARELKDAQDRARQVATYTSRVPGFTSEDGYEAARRIHAWRLAEGEVPVGRKIGFTNTTIWERYGVHEPMWGYVYRSTHVVAKGSHARCMPERYRGFCEPRIEPEIVFRMRAVPPADAGLAEILGCVEWVAHGFEIVHTHFPGWKFLAPDTKADNGLHGALFVGDPRSPSELGEDLVSLLASFTVELSCGGSIRDRGTGANVLGNPLSALRHLLAVLARQPGSTPLAPGEIVTTGTLTDAQPVKPGETWTTALHGLDLPGMTLAFE